MEDALTKEALLDRISGAFHVPMEWRSLSRLKQPTTEEAAQIDEWLKALAYSRLEDLEVAFGISLFGTLLQWPDESFRTVHLWELLDVGSYDGKVDIDGCRMYGHDKLRWRDTFEFCSLLTREQCEVVLAFLRYVKRHIRGSLVGSDQVYRMIRFWQGLIAMRFN